MKDVLNEIIAHKYVEIAQYKEVLPARSLYSMVELKMENDGDVISMCDALMKSKTGIISEFKRKSPSKGWINEAGRADEIPLSYQQSGATAVSILTDSKYFGGYDEYIQSARASGVAIPILYKNFIIDEYQLFQARYCGASAVLLIAAGLKIDECKTLLCTAKELGLEVLLEMHSEHDLDYAELEPDMYGINNRNLGTFVTDVQNSFSMAARLPNDVCLVSESGINNPEIVKMLKLAGFNGFLIGENFMKTEKPGNALSEFINQLK